MGEEKKIHETAEVIEGVLKAVPVYQDVAQPAMKEFGKGLEVAAKVAMLPLQALKPLVWGYEKIEDFLEEKLHEKLAHTPPENIQPPPINVAGPAVEAMRFASEEPTLRDMYATLLATSMDSRTARTAHPGFVEIIKQIAPDEALLCKLFSRHEPVPVVNVVRNIIAPPHGQRVVRQCCTTCGKDAGCQNLDLVPQYLGNLERLGIISVDMMKWYTNETIYQRLLDAVEPIRKELDVPGETNGEIQKGMIELTPFGHAFVLACLDQKGPST